MASPPDEENACSNSNWHRAGLGGDRGAAGFRRDSLSQGFRDGLAKIIFKDVFLPKYIINLLWLRIRFKFSFSYWLLLVGKDSIDVQKLCFLSRYLSGLLPSWKKIYILPSFYVDNYVLQTMTLLFKNTFSFWISFFCLSLMEAKNHRNMLSRTGTVVMCVFLPASWQCSTCALSHALRSEVVRSI